MRLGTAIECLVDNYKYASDKEWINDKVAWALYHTWKEADRKTEPSSSEIPNSSTISKMEQVDKDINVRSKDCTTCKHAGEVYEDPCELCYRHSHYEPKDEPQTDCGDFADRLAYERGVKHAWEVAQKVFNSTVTFYEAEDVAKQIDKDINVRSKDEPQTDIHDLTDCDFCKDRNCKDCEGGKDEPQTETEIAKAIVHKMIDDAVIAEDAYPDLRQKMHDAVDEYEPQTEEWYTFQDEQEYNARYGKE